MLTLNDGRSELWQWDTGSTLAVDADCSQVHFSNKVFGRSIDVDVVDGIAIIPDILLQTDKDLTAWAFAGTAENGYTKIEKTFKVNRRNKPADYVFTPPEQTSLGELIERLDKIEEEQIPDAVKNAVEDYLEKNPADVQSVNGKTGAVQLSAADVGARPENWTPTAQDVGALPNTYTPPNQTAEQVGADPKGTAASAVSQHNTAEDSHGDIRLELKAIRDRLTAFFDSDDQTLDELSEIVSYITNNKTLIESITTSKVSVADIVNNLTTNVSNKPLSAAQGVVLRGLIDKLQSFVDDAALCQPDWNQNDETAKDYVKNRFGGYYEKVYDALLEETELNFSHELVNLEDCDYAYTAYLDESTVVSLWEGGTVRVVFDGVTYEKTYESYGFAPDDSVPFGIFADIIDLGKAFIYTLSDEDSHTVEISKIESTAVPVPEEFLPHSVKVQPDWSVNDETDPAYVKNRTHWVGDPVETLYMEEQTLTAVDGGAMQYAPLPDGIVIEDGVSYRVVVNGDSYTGVGYLRGGVVPTIGNYAEYVSGAPSSGNGEPFIIFDDGYFGMAFYSHATLQLKAGDTITLALYRIEAEVHPLPPELGGMPTLAEDGSDGGKFVKANAAGDGYELTDGYDVIVYENRPSFSASSGGTDCPPLIKAADFDTVKAKLLAGDLPVALYRRDYYKQDDTGEYLSTASYNVIQNSQAAYYDVEEDYIVFDFPSPESISYIATPSGRLILRPNGTVDYS